ncbi:hypothetical protein EJB05_45703, partial [Eragrostis curvula]
MTSRLRSCIRGLTNIALPFLFFFSLLHLSTRQPSLDIAVREEAVAGAGRLRVFVDHAATSADAVANVTTGKVQANDIAAVANEGDGAKVMTNAPPAANDAATVATEAANSKVPTGKQRVSDGVATVDNSTNSDDDTVVFDFRPYVLVYKSGRVHRFHGTGVASTDVADGVTARLYLPPKHRRKAKGGGRRRKLPVLLYFHGGAFVIESPFSPFYHAFLNILVSKAAAMAVSVHYRLAPEHPLPAAYDDAWAALQWTVSNCRSGPDAWLAGHGDATRIFLAGDSSGANIAHNLAVRTGAEPALPGAAVAGVALLNPYFWGSEPVGSEPGDRWMRDGLEKTWALVCGGRYGIDDPHRQEKVVKGSR